MLLASVELREVVEVRYFTDAELVHHDLPPDEGLALIERVGVEVLAVRYVAIQRVLLRSQAVSQTRPWNIEVRLRVLDLLLSRLGCARATATRPARFRSLP